MTLNNDVITVNYCVNYGGRTEIAEAARDIAREAAAGKLNPERVNEATDRPASAPPGHSRRGSAAADLGGAADQ